MTVWFDGITNFETQSVSAHMLNFNYRRWSWRDPKFTFGSTHKVSPMLLPMYEILDAERLYYMIYITKVVHCAIWSLWKRSRQFELAEVYINLLYCIRDLFIGLWINNNTIHELDFVSLPLVTSPSLIISTVNEVRSEVKDLSNIDFKGGRQDQQQTPSPVIIPG